MDVAPPSSPQTANNHPPHQPTQQTSTLPPLSILHQPQTALPLLPSSHTVEQIPSPTPPSSPPLPTPNPPPQATVLEETVSTEEIKIDHLNTQRTKCCRFGRIMPRDLNLLGFHWSLKNMRLSLRKIHLNLLFSLK